MMGSILSHNMPLNLQFIIDYILAGYVPHNCNVAAANFPQLESFRSTIVAPCVPALPKCSSGLGEIASAGLPNGHVKDHCPGKLFASVVLHI
jgi:hypothetical protein